ncbi:MAG: GntR family transcriptional regulator [Acidimicrobiia bacterium]
MTGPTVENRTLAEQVYEFLRGEILSERAMPGSELSEVALAETLGISRGPVREAMGRLRAESLVDVRPRRGTVVASLSKQEFLDAYQVRVALEVLAVREGTPKCTPDSLATIDALMKEMDEVAAGNDEEGFFALNRRLHHAICELSGNEILLDIYDRLIARMVRYSHRSATLRGDLVSSLAEHQAIVDAVRRGDAEAAGRLMEDHINIPLRKVKSLTDAQWVGLSVG